MRINEEEVAVDSLKHVLCTRCGCKLVQIEPGNDPPDFNLSIDGESLPAEVTSITSRQEYHAQCRQFVECIGKQAAERGALSGTYAFSVMRYPRIPKPTSAEGRRLIELIIAFLKSTRTAAHTGEQQLAKDESGSISISKLSPTGCVVAPAWFGAMWQGDVQAELLTLMQTGVNVKKEKLTKVAIGPGKAILVFYAAFAFADPADAVAILTKVQGFEWFHSVFWAASFADRENTSYPAQPGRDGWFLHSMNKTWAKLGGISIGNGR